MNIESKLKTFMKTKESDRPEIPSIEHGKAKGIEDFQNRVLRPVIKKKHDLLIRIVISQLDRYKIRQSELSNANFEAKVRHLFAKNIAFKNLIYGVILSDFSTSEFDLYQEHHNEYNRRITSIVCKRVLDTFQ